MPLNILQIISKNDRYGAQRIFLDQASVLHKQGNNIIVTCRGAKGYVTEFVRTAGLVYEENSMSSLKDIFSLRQVIKKYKIDVIHTALDRADYFGLLASLLTGCPVFSTMMVPRFHHGFRFAARVIVLSYKQRDVLISKGIRPEKIKLIRPGIDLARFLEPDEAKRSTWMQQLNNDSRHPVLCHVSSLIPRKSHDVSLEIISALVKRGADPLLIIIGDPLHGEYYDSLQQKITALGISENVRFTGWTADVAEIMSLSDFTILPSENEALGVVLMEGMAAGTPIIARENEGGAELIEQYESGFLYQPATGTDVLADKIMNCFSDKDQYIKLSNRCRDIAKQEFSMEKFGEEILKVYEEAGISS